MRRALVVVLLVTAGGLLGCSSPEATRTRGGGPGGDVGNRREVVVMHEGSSPFHGTPRIVSTGASDLAPAGTARRVSQR